MRRESQWHTAIMCHAVARDVDCPTACHGGGCGTAPESKKTKVCRQLDHAVFNKPVVAQRWQMNSVGTHMCVDHHKNY